MKFLILRSTFDSLNIITPPLSTTKPQLTCLNYEKSIMVNTNEAFNLTLLIVDKSTQVKIPNITWNVI